MTHAHTPDGSTAKVAPSLKVAFAIAHQRVQDLHFHAVMELIGRARGEIAAPQSLAVYVRVHNLSEADAQTLKNRVMVHMGRAAHADIHHLPNTFVAIDGAVEWDVNASLVEKIRKRVGGRRRHALREWVELHTGHVEIQLQRLHVECLGAVQQAAGAGVRLRDVVASYARQLGVRASMVDSLYFAFAGQLFAGRPIEERSRDTDAADDPGRTPDARRTGGAPAPDGTLHGLKARRA